MDKILIKKETLTAQLSFGLLSLVGCSLIILGSLAKIPFFPVPFTLQTLALFILALTQSPKQACGSALCYLLLATLGLPVFCGRANPFWLIGKCGGYLVAFPLAAYLTAKMAERYSPLIAIFCGQAVIYFLGFIWLIPFVGITTAWVKGVVFFIYSDLLKNLIAYGAVIYWKRYQLKTQVKMEES